MPLSLNKERIKGNMKITQITRYQKDQTVHSTKFQNLNLIS